MRRFHWCHCQVFPAPTSHADCDPKQYPEKTRRRDGHVYRPMHAPMTCCMDSLSSETVRDEGCEAKVWIRRRAVECAVPMPRLALQNESIVDHDDTHSTQTTVDSLLNDLNFPLMTKKRSQQSMNYHKTQWTATWVVCKQRNCTKTTHCKHAYTSLCQYTQILWYTVAWLRPNESLRRQWPNITSSHDSKQQQRQLYARTRTRHTLTFYDHLSSSTCMNKICFNAAQALMVIYGWCHSSWVAKYHIMYKHELNLVPPGSYSQAKRKVSCHTITSAKTLAENTLWYMMVTVWCKYSKILSQEAQLKRSKFSLDLNTVGEGFSRTVSKKWVPDSRWRKRCMAKSVLVLRLR